MKKLNVLLILVLSFAGYTANAQVKFKMTHDKTTGRYTVYVVPTVSYSNPQNITGTGQVTIKVPSNQFDPVDIVNHLSGMHWEANSRNNSPTESPESDYISFGLIIQGVAYPNYQAGVDLPIFSFQNAFGCSGKVSLVDNYADPFMPPNSQSANIGNTLTILGAGGDAYAGNVNGGVTNCNETGTTDTEEELSLKGFKIFPNPAADFTNVEIKWKGASTEASLQIVDAHGRTLHSEAVSIDNGVTSKKLDVTNLAPGNYFVQLQGEDWKISLDRFTKQ